MCSLHVDHMTDHMRNRGDLHNALLLYFTLDVCELNSDMCLDEVDMLHVTGHEGDMEAAVSCQRLRSCSERHRILCLWCRIGSCIHGIRGRHIVQRVKSFCWISWNKDRFIARRSGYLWSRTITMEAVVVAHNSRSR